MYRIGAPESTGMEGVLGVFSVEGKKLKRSLEEIGQGEYVAQRFSLTVFDSGSLPWSFKICISNKFPGQGNAAGLGITLREPIVWRKASMLG